AVADGEVAFLGARFVGEAAQFDVGLRDAAGDQPIAGALRVFEMREPSHQGLHGGSPRRGDIGDHRTRSRVASTGRGGSALWTAVAAIAAWPVATAIWFSALTTSPIAYTPG